MDHLKFSQSRIREIFFQNLFLSKNQRPQKSTRSHNSKMSQYQEHWKLLHIRFGEIKLETLRLQLLYRHSQQYLAQYFKWVGSMLQMSLTFYLLLIKQRGWKLKDMHQLGTYRKYNVCLSHVGFLLDFYLFFSGLCISCCSVFSKDKIHIV